MANYVHIPLVPQMQERSDVPYGHASMLLLGEGSEATEPYNKYDKIRPHSIRSLQFDQKFRPLSFRPEKLDLFTATCSRLSDISKSGSKCFSLEGDSVVMFNDTPETVEELSNLVHETYSC